MKLRDHLDATWPMPAGEGPCRTWPFSPGCGCLELPDPAPGGIDPETLTPDERFAAEAATWLLWSLTAGHYGLCEQTARPCRTPARPRTRAEAWPVPVLAGQWFNITCGCQPADDGCGCPGGARLLLPGDIQWEYERPPSPPEPSLAPLMVVWLDGKPLDPTSWRFAPPNRLYRLDGGVWPATQDMSLPLTEPGTFGVTFWTGTPVPPLGRRAVAVLACELLKACEGDTSCALPTHWVERVDREGIRYEFDPLELIEKGRTGLPEVDQFIAAANPGRHRGPSLVISPDLPTWQEDFSPPQFPPGPGTRP